MSKRAFRVWGIVFVLLLFAAACGDDDDTSDAGSDSGDQSQDDGDGGEEGSETLVVGVDALSDDFELATTAYFPKALTAQPGDTISFESVWTGEPHTVTFGTLVDDGLEKAFADPEAEEPPEELAKIPMLLPEGPGDAIQAAAQPCFLPEGEDPPAEEACTPEQQEQPTFDGSHALYSSGFLPEGDVFDVELSEDLEPGTYSYFCELHREGMVGEITVVDDGAEADSAADVEAARAEAEDAMVEAMAPVAEAIAAGSIPGLLEGGPGQVIAGGLSEEVMDGLVVSFGPADVSVAVGETVTWTVLGPHTVSFGASEAQRAAIFRDPDGSVHINPESFGPVGGEGQPPPPEGAEGPPPEGAPPTPIDGGTYDGTGFRNSGLILSFPGSLFQYKLTFSEPGTYEYFCLIHPEMAGTVNVD